MQPIPPAYVVVCPLLYGITVRYIGYHHLTNKYAESVVQINKINPTGGAEVAYRSASTHSIFSSRVTFVFFPF